MGERLQENGDPVTIGGVTIRTPGLRSTVEVYEPLDSGTRSAMRAAESSMPALHDALHNARATEQLTIQLADVGEVEIGAELARRGPSQEPVIEGTVPSPGDRYGQFVIANDEAGLVSWHFPRREDNSIDTTRGASTRTYLIPRRVLEVSSGGAEVRGLFGSIGS